ncbi:MAG: AarF/UbiB family protein [Halobacteriovoraceae bacterium]|nr:AarF/UbiB family protein [Halobacteriovoraceae bacterium]
MDIIRTSISISKTIRNVGRLREIVSILGKNGFNEFITRGVVSKIPNFVLPEAKIKLKEELASQSKNDWGRIIGSRLSRCLEELGPAFIKFGQLLGSREDIFDSSFIDEMRYLRDKVKGIPFSQVKNEIEHSLGKSIDEVFESLEEEAFGTASIGIVHRGILKNGKKVVVKVRRPGIAKTIETDFSIISFITTQAEKISNEIKYLGLHRLIDEFYVSIQDELNFHIESLNARRLQKNIGKHDDKKILYVPKIYDEYTTEKILVMEFLDGIPFTSKKQLKLKKDVLHKNLEAGLDIFIKTFLQDGFFHADLHGGNFFLLKNEKIGIVDFGLMGTLSRKGRQNLVAIVYALISSDYENLVYEFLDIAQYERVPDVDTLIIDVRKSISPFMGLTIKQINLSHILQRVTQTLYHHQIFLPREWFIVFRAMVTLDGVGKSIDMDINIFSKLEQNIDSVLKKVISKDILLEEGAWVGRDTLSFARIVPRHLKWFIRSWVKSNYSFRLIHTDLEKFIVPITSSIVFLGFCLLASVFILSGVLLIDKKIFYDFSELSFLVWFFWMFALFFIIRGIFSLKK